MAVATPILAIIPAFNEADNLPHVLAALPAEVGGHPLRALVVDDGSSDGTADVAESLGAIVERSPENRGGGHALRLGFARAAKLRARWVLTLDADGQHDPNEIPQMMEPLFRGEADVVVGSRMLGQSVGGTITRGVGLRSFNAIISVLTRRRITDCASGFRAFELEKLGRLVLVQQRHHTAELLIAAAAADLRIVEVPIVISPRLSGVSKKGPDWRYGMRFARTVAHTWWRTR